MKDTFYLNRYNKPNPRFFDRQLDRHVFDSAASLFYFKAHLSRQSSHVYVKWENVEMVTHSKLPYNALQTLEH